MQIDFGQAVTADAKAEAAAQARAVAIKGECGGLIRDQISPVAQDNIAQSVMTYTALRLRGTAEAEAQAASGMNDADFTIAAAGRGWIAAMQAECRRAIAAGDDPAWPALPDGVAELVARF